ncbi:unnamed protein product [Somion occarium]|uniref:Uncharacterized protein n=1 Tax=Somion occarium TaxID=3059160 RepID=A0ABP1CPQ3_9APHY
MLESHGEPVLFAFPNSIWRRRSAGHSSMAVITFPKLLKTSNIHPAIQAPYTQLMTSKTLIVPPVEPDGLHPPFRTRVPQNG